MLRSLTGEVERLKQQISPLTSQQLPTAGATTATFPASQYAHNAQATPTQLAQPLSAVQGQTAVMGQTVAAGQLPQMASNFPSQAVYPNQMAAANYANPSQPIPPTYAVNQAQAPPMYAQPAVNHAPAAAMYSNPVAAPAGYPGPVYPEPYGVTYEYDEYPANDDVYDEYYVDDDYESDYRRPTRRRSSDQRYNDDDYRSS